MSEDSTILSGIEREEYHYPLRDLNFGRDYHMADRQYELIMSYIKDFESDLNDDSEVAIQLANFGQSVTINVTSIGYANPDLICFYGYVNGNSAQLIQHISQLSFLLLAVPKSDPSLPARRIGFDVERG